MQAVRSHVYPRVHRSHVVPEVHSRQKDPHAEENSFKLPHDFNCKNIVNNILMVLSVRTNAIA